jgi:hypothetical protein
MCLWRAPAGAALDRAALHPLPLPRERVTVSNWMGGWVDSRACLDDVEKKKFLILPGLELRLLCCPWKKKQQTFLQTSRFLFEA